MFQLKSYLLNLVVMVSMLFSAIVPLGATQAEAVAPVTPERSLAGLAQAPLQFQSGDHLAGFLSDKAYLAALDHALSVEFVGAAVSDIIVVPRDYVFTWGSSGQGIEKPGVAVDCSSNPDHTRVLYWRTSDTDPNAGVNDWNPNVLVAGQYDIYVFIPQYNVINANITTQAKYYFNGGLLAQIDQNQNKCQWVLLGRRSFTVGTGDIISIPAQTSDNPYRLIAGDGLKLVYINPVPSISGLSPSSVVAGSSAFALLVSGSNFVDGAVVRWNGSDRTTTFVNSTQLQATISAADIATAGTASVTVFNPTPGGGTSNAVTLNIHIPLDSVTLAGPTSGAINATYAFTASISPVTATTPITYTWSPAPISGQGTVNASYTWATTGTKTITVTAQNPVNTVTNTHVIVISAQSAGDAYEPDDTCQQARAIVVGGAAQSHNFHQQADADWVQFSVITNATYIIEGANPGPNADLAYELYDLCGGPPQTFGNNAFGNGFRFTFDSPFNGRLYLKVMNFNPALFGAGTGYSLTAYLDQTPPATPQNFRATAGNASLLLQWQANSESDAHGYRLRYGTQPGVYGAPLDITGRTTIFYNLAGLINATRYYLVLSAVDYSGNESVLSAEINATPQASADLTVPAIVIQGPTTAGVYTTTLSSIAISGTSRDTGGNLAYVEVTNGANGSQRFDDLPASVASAFQVNDLLLELGANQITARVYDRARNQSAATLTIYRVQGQGVGIIIAGRDKKGLNANINYMANRAYRIFLKAGFAPQNLYYLSPETWQDAHNPLDGVNDVNGFTSPANIQAALTTWAAGRVGPDVPVFLYLVDHGVEDYFCANQCDVGQPTGAGRVWADELDGWLTTLENAGAQNVNVIIEACFSGSFIEPAKEISKPGRVILTATSRAQSAYASAEGAHFSDALWTSLEHGKSLRQAFVQATQAVSLSVGLWQQPFLDDNGNATPNDATDGAVAATRYLLTTLGDAPELTLLEPRATLNLSNTLEMSVRVQEGAEPPERVWVTLYPPSWTLPEPQPGQTPVDNATLVELSDANGDQVYTASVAATETGAYRLVFYARVIDGTQAEPQALEVHTAYPVYLPLIQR